MCSLVSVFINTCDDVFVIFSFIIKIITNYIDFILFFSFKCILQSTIQKAHDRHEFLLLFLLFLLFTCCCYFFFISMWQASLFKYCCCCCLSIYMFEFADANLVLEIKRVRKYGEMNYNLVWMSYQFDWTCKLTNLYKITFYIACQI